MRSPLTRLAAAAALALALACGSDGDAPSAPTPSVAVTGVGLDSKAIALMVGGTGTLTARVMPSGAANRSVTWSCAGEAATLSASGDVATVTARRAGAATVRVTAAEGGWTDDCLVTVTDGAVAVAGVSLDKAAMGLVPGSAGVLTADVLPANATNRDVEWASSDTSVATVAKGEGATAWVTAADSGSATITATTGDGGFTATCAVTVAPYVVPVVSMGMDKPSMELPMGGGDGSLRVAFAPPNASPAVTWSSSNTAAATVAGSGAGATVTPVAVGSATITAAIGGGLAATCAVTVVPPTPGNISIFVAGAFGLYMNGQYDHDIAGQDLSAVHVDNQEVVHAAGRTGSWEAAYYRDGACALLPMSFPGADESRALGLDVTGDGHVYIAGYEASDYGYYMVARLWKDGAQSPLPGNDETGHYGSVARAVRVRGSDVYVAGGAYDTADGAARPVIWKNGTRHLFTEANDFFVDMGITAGGAIYGLAGGDVWEISADLSSMAPVELDGGGQRLHMTVDGSDVYVAGWTGNDACYWKNGERHVIEHPDAAYWLEAEAIHAYQGHTYIAGLSSRSSGYRTELWIDGAFIDDDRAVTDIVNDYDEACPAAIFVRHVVGTPATGLALSSPSLTIPIGYTAPLTATLTPPNATNKRLAWASSDPAVASVAGAGLSATVAGLDAGTATITAASADGPTASCSVTVQRVSVTGLSLPPTFAVGRGRVGVLTATITPETATDKGVAWASADPAIAEVSGTGPRGTVRGVGIGSTTITATSRDGSFPAVCAVTVAEPAEPAFYLAGEFGLYMDGTRDEDIGGQGLRDVFVDALGNVHAAGNHDDTAGGGLMWNAAHYRNGEVAMLPTAHGGDTMESGATKVVVADGGDAYVAGWEYYMNEWGWTAFAARLWKDGALVPLQGVDEAGFDWSYATSVQLRGGDVYVGGYDDQTNGYNHPSIWKNGVQHINEDMEDYLILDFGIDPGGALAVVCFNEFAWYWGVPDFTAWRVLPDLETWEEMHLAGHPMQVFVDGADVYFAGYDYPDACYWKNGQKHRLPSPPGAEWAQANDIHVTGGHVYVGGHAEYSVVQWIDGEMVTDSRAIAEEFSYYPSVSGVFAK